MKRMIRTEEILRNGRILSIVESITKGVLGIALIGTGIYAGVMTYKERDESAAVVKDIDGDGVEDIVLREGTQLIRRGNKYFTPEQLKTRAKRQIDAQHQTKLAQLDNFGNPTEWVRNPWDNIDYKVRKDQIKHVRYTPRRTQVR
ncbi:hypothetical protein GOV06_05760 [Candidatus Woesearchaeota archaeon]|nr:hypothetical protein [Candidatus Woesearchaeota archaeon]